MARVTFSSLDIDGVHLKVTRIVDTDSRQWINVKPFAHILNYESVRCALRHVDPSNTRAFIGLKNVHHKTQFVSVEGLLELVDRCNSSTLGEKLREWLTETLNETFETVSPYFGDNNAAAAAPKWAEDFFSRMTMRIQELTQSHRDLLKSLQPRLAPDLRDMPVKQPSLVGYLDGRTLTLRRLQYAQLKKIDDDLELLRAGARVVSRDSSWLTPTTRKVYASECPNAVSLWNRIKMDNPHFTYGVEFTNRTHNTMRLLDCAQIRARFASQGGPYTNADEAVTLAYTSTDSIGEKLSRMIDEASRFQ